MEIKQLQYFVVSVDMGSFHAAADSLLTTQPNVSKVIKSLEDEVHMHLLHRNRNGVTMTPEGENLYRFAVEVLKNLNLIEKMASEQKNEILSIASAPSNRLSSVLSSFYEQYPNKNMKINLTECNVDKILQGIHRRSSEIGFLYISKKNYTAFKKQIQAKGMCFQELKDTSLFLYVGKKNPFYNAKTIHQDELRKMKFIQHDEEQYSLYNHLGHIKEDIFYNENNNSAVSTNSGQLIIQVLNNTALGCIGSSFAEPNYDEYGIRGIPIEHGEDSIIFGCVYRRRDEMTQVGREFIEYIKDCISENKN